MKYQRFETVKRSLRSATVGLLLTATATPALANIELFDYSLNVDGILNPASGVNLSLFDLNTGLGTITVSVLGAGAHYVGLFVDHEIDQSNNTNFNEFGAANGSTAAGQTWEIDEPGFVFGDIYTNFSGSSLDGQNGVPAGSEDDVSMALGWDFVLAADEVAGILFNISLTQPTSGFYLSHTDPDADGVPTIYFSSELRTRIVGVPEPSVAGLLTIGLLALGLSRRYARS